MADDLTPPRRGPVRRVVVVVPSLFTLGNLFLGVWAIVAAIEGEYYAASWYLFIAAVLDVLDGRIARLSGTGSRFGAELDSLADIVSFGLAPGILIHLAVLTEAGPFAWVFSYGFLVGAALRLARFNTQAQVDPHGPFLGMPTPAAGLTLAMFYPFSTTTFYRDVLSDLPWQQIIIFLVLGLSVLMVSHVRYARLPRMGVRDRQGLLGLAVILTIFLIALWGRETRDVFFFPLAVSYMTYGLLRATIMGVVSDRDTEDDPEPGPRRRRRRRRHVPRSE